MNLKLKKAYPNIYDDQVYIGPRDTKKWVDIVKNIYFYRHNGSSVNESIEIATSNMDKMEKKDFINWLRFYEENAHEKYSHSNVKNIKKYSNQPVSYYINSDMPGYILPISSDLYENKDTSGDDAKIKNKINEAKNPEVNEAIVDQERKRQLNNHRKKIVSRLDSVERLLRERQDYNMSDDEFSNLMNAVHTLKIQIYKINKTSHSNRIYEDLIHRASNILKRDGFYKASSFIVKIADDLPAPVAPPFPTDNSGIPGTLPIDSPPPNPQDVGTENSKGMDDFLEGLSNGSVATALDTVDDNNSSDGNESLYEKQLNDDGILNVKDDSLEYENDGDDILVVEAQMAPPPALTATDPPVNPAQPPQKKPLEVKETNINETSGEKIDDKINKIFENITVDDVVSKLNDITKIFKTREIPRQLSIVDMMLDRLGLSTYFPSLAEATNKSLESNQYILSRIEDIVSRLQGSIASGEIDLINENPPINSQEAIKVRENLKKQDLKDKERKRIRKELENEALEESVDENKNNPEIEVSEDLSSPVEVGDQLPPNNQQVQNKPVQPAATQAVK